MGNPSPGSRALAVAGLYRAFERVLMENSLDSILSETVIEAPAPEVAPPATPEPTTAQEPQVTGEEVAAPPAAEPKDDPLEKHRKGLEAAATAERKKRQDAERDLAQARAELEALRRPQPAQTPAPQAEDQKPLRSQYETEDDWLDARDAWRDRDSARQQAAAREEAQQTAVRVKVETVMAEVMTMPNFNIQEFATRVPVTEPMMDAILDSEAPAKLVHFLHTNREEAVRISQLPTTARQIAAITRIEDKLNAAPPPPPTEEKAKPQLPETLTQARNAKGQFEPAYSGPTPLNAILASK